MNASILTYVETHAKELEEELIRIMERLVAIKALAPENGGVGEVAKANYVLDYLKQFPGEHRDYPISDNRVPEGYRPNFAYRMKGKDASRTLWIVSHLDVVPEGDMRLWKTDPYELVVKDGAFIGRGVQDNGSSIATAMLLYKILSEAAVTPAVNFAAAFFADEEVGSVYGIKAVMETYNPIGGNDLVYVPDMNTEKGTVLEIAEKSIVWLTVTFSGIQAHGSRPDLATNAHRAGAYFVVQVDALMKEKYANVDRLFNYPKSSAEPTKILPNVGNVNTIPGEHVLSFDCRLLPGYSIDAFITDMRTLAEETARAHNATAKVDVMNAQQALPATSEHAAAVTIMKKAYQSAFNEEARLVGVGGGTCGYFIREKGIPVVVCGIGAETAHMPNEWISAKDLLKTITLYLHLFNAVE